jgi:hypothetical protein
MSDARIPAIVLQYGRLDLTARCIASLRAQTEAVEIVVVDGATPDLDLRAFAAIEAAADRVITLPANRGYAGNNNVAIATLLAENHACFLLLNHDTELAPDCVAALRRTLEARPRAAQVCPQVRYPDGCLQAAGASIEPRRFEPRLRGHRRSPGDYQHPARVGYAPGMVVLVRMAAVREVGPLPEEYFLYAEDADWSLRFDRAGWEVWYCPTATAVHHDSASVGAWSGRKAFYLTRANVWLARRWLPSERWSGFVSGMIWKLMRQSLRHAFRPTYVAGMWRGLSAGLRNHAHD